MDEKKQVLIIDAETLDIQRISDHLNQYDITVLVATNTKKGVEMFFSELPDLILINLLMPGMSGTDAIKAIKGRTDGLRTPIIVMSQLATPSKTLEKDLGVQGLISKPIDLLKLDEKIRFFFKGLQTPSNLSKAKGKGKKAGPSNWRNTSLAKLPFTKLLAQILKNRASGILTIETKTGKMKIKFVNGNPGAFTPSSFAKFLLRQGHLSPRQAKKLTLVAKEQQLSSKEALGALDIFKADDIDSLFRAFVYDLSAEYAEISDATATFKDKPISQKAVFSTVDMIWQGVRRIYDQGNIDRAFDKDDRRSKPLFLVPGMVPDVKLPKHLQLFLDQIDSKSSVADIRNQFAGQQENIILQFSYTFLLCGILTFNENEIHAKPSENVAPIITDKKALKAKHKKEKKPITQKRKPEVSQRPKEKINGDQFDSVPDEFIVDSNDSHETTIIDDKPDESLITLPISDFSEQEEEPKDGLKITTSASLSNKELFQASLKFIESGAFSKAQACYEELIDRGIEKPEVYVNLGSALYHNRFITNVRERLLNVAWAIKQALVIDSSYLPAYITFAKILEREGKTDIAEDQYKMALAIDSKNPKASAALKRLQR